jgi:xanthine dehydrogenase YagT iron-sulfur-binding subunit
MIARSINDVFIQYQNSCYKSKKGIRSKFFPSPLSVSLGFKTFFRDLFGIIGHLELLSKKYSPIHQKIRFVPYLPSGGHIFKLKRKGADGVMPTRVKLEKRVDRNVARPAIGGMAGELQRNVRGPGKVPVELIVNGQTYKISAEPRRTLLDALRKDCGLTGTKKSCDEGTCGACTVLLDGKPVYACMVLAIECERKPIETIEGLEKNGRLHPVQQAFVEEDGFQCGFCTPGQVMSVKALLDMNPNPTSEEVQHALSGNLCRCGAYPKIIKAAFRAAKLLRSGT